MKLLGKTKTKITKHKNRKKGPHLQINEVVVINCDILNNNY